MQWIVRFFGLGTTIIGLIVGGTLAYSDLTHRLANSRDEIDSLHADMRSVDRRLNDATSERAVLDKRIALLEAQLQWAAHVVAETRPAKR